MSMWRRFGQFLPARRVAGAITNVTAPQCQFASWKRSEGPLDPDIGQYRRCPSTPIGLVSQKMRDSEF